MRKYYPFQTANPPKFYVSYPNYTYSLLEAPLNSNLWRPLHQSLSAKLTLIQKKIIPQMKRGTLTIRVSFFPKRFFYMHQGHQTYKPRPIGSIEVEDEMTLIIVSVNIRKPGWWNASLNTFHRLVWKQYGLSFSFWGFRLFGLFGPRT